MGIVQGWLLLVSLPPSVSPLALGSSIGDSIRWLFVASSLGLGLAIIGRLHHKAHAFLAHPAFLYGGILFFLLGNSLVLFGNNLILLSFLGSDSVQLRFFFNIAGSLTSGVGAAVLVVRWSAVFFEFDEKLLRVSVSFTFMFASLFAVAIDLLPLSLGTILLFAAFGFACAGLVFLSKNEMVFVPSPELETDKPADKDGTEPSARVAIKNIAIKPFTFMLGVAAMTLCFWAVFYYCTTIGQLVEATSREAFVPTMLLGALAALVLALLHLKLNRQLWFCPTIATMAACLGLSIMLVEPFGVPAIPIAYALSFPLMLIALIGLWIMALKLAQRKVFPLAVCVAGFLAPIYAGMVVGSLCALSLAEGFPFVRIVLLFALLCPSLVLQSFLNERERYFLQPVDAAELPEDSSAINQLTVNQLTDSHHLLEEVLSELSERYGLSKREQEVLPYLAKGRDIVYIGEELVISKNTVISHTKHLYRKMGIHSKQELISLVEQTANHCQTK